MKTKKKNCSAALTSLYSDFRISTSTNYLGRAHTLLYYKKLLLSLLLLFPCSASAGSRRFFYRGHLVKEQSEEGYSVMIGTSDSK